MLCTVAPRKQAKRCLIGWQPLHSKRSSKELLYLQRAPLVDLTHSSLVKWVNISEPGRLARFFRCLISR